MGKRKIRNFPELTDITDGSTIRDMGLPALFSFFLILKTGRERERERERERQIDRQSLEVQLFKGGSGWNKTRPHSLF
jgi:hypothetical protein